MMGIKYFVLFFSFSCLFIKAQTPYALFHGKSELFFHQPDFGNELVGLKADSVKVTGTDSIYYHYRIMDYKSNTGGNCTMSAQSPSWLGFKTIRNASDDYIFFNRQNDSLTIKPGMPLNSSWKYYTYSNGDYIKATISLKQYEVAFDAVSDTVKTISFQAYNNLNNPIANDYNSKTFKIGRTTGILKLGNIYDFPADTSIYKRCYGKRLTGLDVADHAIGETIQIYSVNSNHATLTYVETSKTYTYLTKTNPTINSVVYTVSLTLATQSHTASSSATSSSVTVSTQTIAIANLDHYIINQMPQQLHSYAPLVGTIIHYYYYNTTSSNCRNKFMIKYLDCYQYTGTSDTCFSISVSCPEPKNRTIIKGLQIDTSGYFTSIPNGPNNPTSFDSYPVYSTFTGNPCGSVIFLGVEDLSLDYELKLFPNPVSENLMIRFSSSPGILEIKIMDLIGKEMMSAPTTENTLLNVSALNPGIYFLKVKTGSGEFTRKFIKQ